MFCSFCVCVCVFLFVHISVDFRVPLADALGQTRSILDRCWCHCWINFPALSAARAELLQRLRKKLLKKLAENLQITIKKVTRMQRTCRELATNLCKELSHKRNLKRRIPFFDATSVKNVKNNQKLPRTFKNLDLEIALLQFAVTPAAATNACPKTPRFKIGGRRCSRRMAHSDLPPPSVLRANSESECCSIFRTPTLSLPGDAASPADPSKTR
jgi:hypothetical protein